MKKIKFIHFLIAIFIAETSSSQVDINTRILKELNEHKKGVHSESKNRHNCVSYSLLEAKKNWNNLNDETKDAARVFLVRPSLPSEELYYSTYFDFHYTQTGADAVDPTDDNLNNVPDYVELMGDIFDYVYLELTTTLNYAAPPSDIMEGGSAFYDIYISDIGTGLYGFVAPETDVMNNPQSPLVEFSSMTSYMGMSNDYSWVGSGTEIEILNAVKVTAAHEYFHSVQFGYSSDRTNFIFESTAAWIEDVVYPGIDDNLQYLPGMFTAPDVSLSLNSDDSQDYGDHWYGGWIFFKYLQEQYTTNIVRDIWEKCIAESEMAAVESSIGFLGGNFDQEFGAYLVSNAFLTDDTNFAPYTYSRASVYSNYLTNDASELNFEGTINSIGDSWDSEIDGNARLQRLSADYFVINHTNNQDFKITLDCQNNEVDIVLVKINSLTSDFDIQTSVANGNLIDINVTDQELYDSFYAIVGRVDKLNLDTLSSQYTINTTSIVGLVSNNETSVINLYPSPANDVMKISGSENVDFVTITDLSGRQIFSGKINNNIINLEKIEDGLYITTLFGENNAFLGSRKIIIKH